MLTFGAFAIDFYELIVKQGKISYNVGMVDILGEKRICHKCGKCCRLIASNKSYEELCEDAQNGDKVSSNFLKLFLPYETTVDAENIDAEVVAKIKEYHKNFYGKNSKTYFYYCRYIDENNLCKLYDMRPKFCRQYPKSEFTPLPTDCAYEGYSFVVREKIKARVRKAKENLLELNILKENSSQDRGSLEKLKKIEENYKKLIDDYSKFGSLDW